jgi:cyclic lactone autoinducer peptide
MLASLFMGFGNVIGYSCGSVASVWDEPECPEELL